GLQLPVQDIQTWADTQDELGISLRRLGLRNDSLHLLKEASEAHRAAAEVRTPAHVLPLVRSQLGLGSTLYELGRRDSNRETLSEAIARLGEALSGASRLDALARYRWEKKIKQVLEAARHSLASIERHAT